MNAKLLIIDDEKDLVETIKSSLVPRGYDVVSAFDGEEGLRKAEESEPDLIICDVKMPKLDGWEVLKRIRQNHSRWVPVIMLTVLKELSDVRKGYEYEADYYIGKPFKIEDLLNGIRIILSLRPSRSG